MLTLSGSRGYLLHATRKCDDVEAAQRLRYEVFNVELGEGLAESHTRGLDADPFDTQCDHLIVEETGSGLVVGTYRLQTGIMAAEGLGYYSAQEFDFSPYDPLRDEVLELGRACIHKDHRSRAVLDLLWRGIGNYAEAHGCGYLLGCSSLTSLDPAEGWGLYRQLESSHLAPPELRTVPIGDYVLPVCDRPKEKIKVPKLFATYLSIGAVIAGPPAIDRQFKTIDFLTILDLTKASRSGRRHFLFNP